MNPLSAWAAGGITFLAPTLVWAGTGEEYGRHMMWYGGGHGMLWGLVMMILVIAVIVVVVVLLVRWLGGAHHGAAPASPPGRAALDILSERYARGEIDREEFEERRRVLGE